MIPIILLVAVLAVGALGVFAMVLGMKKQLAERRRKRAQIAARADRVRETARIQAEYAAQRAARAAAAPPPVRFDDGSLTGLFHALEQTGPFAVVAAPPSRVARGTAAPPPRPSVPPPRPSVRQPVPPRAAARTVRRA